MKDENRGLFIVGLVLLSSLFLFTSNTGTYNIQTDTSIINIGEILSLNSLTLEQKNLVQLY